MKHSTFLRISLFIIAAINNGYLLAESSPVEQDELSQFGSTREREENAHLHSGDQAIDTEIAERGAIYSNPAQLTSVGERMEIKNPNDSYYTDPANRRAVSVYSNPAQRTSLQEKITIRPHNDAQLTTNAEKRSRSAYVDPASDTKRQEEIARKGN
jgi:hypothetical protein